ncbi:MAG: DUF1064 domain-containing protein [Planctomycetota bacterium]
MQPIHTEPKYKNKAEEAYAGYLHLLKCGKVILDYHYEDVKLRLGEGTFFTPDFLVIYKDRFEFHEVKGFMREAARVRINTAASLYPWAKFLVVKSEGKKKGWAWTEVGNGREEG